MQDGVPAVVPREELPRHNYNSTIAIKCVPNPNSFPILKRTKGAARYSIAWAAM
jgi:hypothetical protein